MLDGEGKDIIAALEAVYGEDKVGRSFHALKKANPHLSQEQLLRRWEEAPTSDYSFFQREANIRILAQDVMGKEKEKSWRVLCVGCASGQEPYELALRLLKQGQTDFQIDAIDVSEQAIAQAQKGQIRAHFQYYMIPNLEQEFLEEMVQAGLLHKSDTSSAPKKGKKGNIVEEPIVFNMPEAATTRLHFSRHDIIDAPFGEEAKYDIVICNNVLLHYPPWTRELILAHMLCSLKQGGRLVLEPDEWLGGFGMTTQRAGWLAQYYEWRKDLSRFGLTHPQAGLDESISFFPNSFYDYNPSNNQFRGKNLVIRDKKLVEIT